MTTIQQVQCYPQVPKGAHRAECPLAIEQLLKVQMCILTHDLPSEVLHALKGHQLCLVCRDYGPSVALSTAGESHNNMRCAY